MTAVQKKKNHGWPKSQNYISWCRLTQSATTDLFHWVENQNENSLKKLQLSKKKTDGPYFVWSPAVMDRGYSQLMTYDKEQSVVFKSLTL